MKKQLIALGLASILTVPSVVLAEATWYGSFRGIVHSQGGETSMMSNGSRWGVKGSSEVSEGLTAVYRYEEDLNLANATLGAGNRLSSVGLSGGFGTVTLGQIWSASYNHVGVLTDNGVWSGNQSQIGRTGSALSYSASSGPVSFQIDANMNGGTGRSVDMAQLGMSFDTGAAKVGLAVITKESAKDSTRQSSIGVSVPVGGLTLYSSWSEKEVTTFATPGSEAVVIPGIKDFQVPGSPGFTVPGSPGFMVPGRDEIVVPGYPGVEAQAAQHAKCKIERWANAVHPEIPQMDDDGNVVTYQEELLDDDNQPFEPRRFTTKTSMVLDKSQVIKKPDSEDPLELVSTRYILPTLGVRTIDEETGEITEGMFTCPESSPALGINGIALRILEPGSPAVQEVPAGKDFTISEIKHQDIPEGESKVIKEGESKTIKGTDDYELMAKVDPTPETTVKTRHMHAGVSGSLGDTGMSFAINVANHPDSSDGENPWNFNVSKSLGGGASLAFEYIDNDSMETSNEALVQLRVDF